MTVLLKSGNISQEQVESLNAEGFIRPRPIVVEPSSLNSITEKLLTVMRNKDVHPIYNQHSVRDWHLVFPELVDFVSHESVLGSLKSIMGDNLILWRSHIFYKPPGTGPVGWHQDFGTFSGEDIGNNKVSLVPCHIDGISEDTLTNYLPEALEQTSSEAAPDSTNFWNMTVWVALSDITSEMGPLRFLPGSHRKRYPVRMMELSQSDFWQDPFVNIRNTEELVSACRKSKLVLDVDTSSLLNDIRADTANFEDLKKIVLDRLKKLSGSTTVTDEIDSSNVENFPMSKGSYLLFSERTMHGSSANKSEHERLAVNFRVTVSSTLVYPSRLRGDFVDGFNINIKDHKCILLSGENLNENNRIEDISQL